MGNFSRETFDKLKHYVGVRLQQGVPLIDADWNEQEDIRKYELRTFLKWFFGNGVPADNDGFRILPAEEKENSFIIKGGDGSAEGAGRCLVDGWDVINENNILYSEQALFDNSDLADKWGVDTVKPLTTPTSDRVDTVYLDIWEREVDAEEDNELINPAIGVETCVRLKRQWVVRVAEGAAALPEPPQNHVFYPLAYLKRPAQDNIVKKDYIKDLRQTGLSFNSLLDEITDARGIKANLGNRLDESLTKGGKLRQNTVSLQQLKANLVVDKSVTLKKATQAGSPGVTYITYGDFNDQNLYLINVSGVPTLDNGFISWREEISYSAASGASIARKRLRFENIFIKDFTVHCKIYRLEVK